MAAIFLIFRALIGLSPRIDVVAPSPSAPQQDIAKMFVQVLIFISLVPVKTNERMEKNTSHTIPKNRYQFYRHAARKDRHLYYCLQQGLIDPRIFAILEASP
jgi:hypothetical protein